MAGEYRAVRWRRLTTTLATLAAAFSIGEGRAEASETFPPILAEKLGMDCVPNCLPCHLQPVGTAENQRGDGIKAELERLAGNMVTSDLIVSAALDELLKENKFIDSDADGTSDLEELSDGQNPYGGLALCERPLYGCFASHVTTTMPTRLGALGMALGVMGGLLWRRRAPRARPRLSDRSR